MSLPPFMVLFGSHASAGGGPDFSVLDSNIQTLGAAGTTLTISGINFGSGGNVVVACSYANAEAASVSVSSIDINGTAASSVATSGGGAAAFTFIYSAASVAGGTGDVVITFNSSRTHTVVYGVYNIGTRTTENTDSSDANQTALSDTVDVSSDGVVISTMYHNVNGSTTDFTGGVDTDENHDVLGTRPGAVGHREYPSGATPATVTTTTVASSNHRSATASFS